MKIGLGRAIIIGAAVVTFGGLLVQGALATTAPQPVPLSTRTAAPPAVDSQTARNYVDGMINYMQGYVNQETASGQVTPQEQQAFNQMYGYMRQYSGVMYNMMGGFYGNQGTGNTR